MVYQMGRIFRPTPDARLPPPDARPLKKRSPLSQGGGDRFAVGWLVITTPIRQSPANFLSRLPPAELRPPLPSAPPTPLPPKASMPRLLPAAAGLPSFYFFSSSQRKTSAPPRLSGNLQNDMGIGIIHDQNTVESIIESRLTQPAESCGQVDPLLLTR